MLERRTIPHDLLEVHLATDFLLEIEFLLCKLLFQIGDLAEGEAVFDSDSYLTRRFLKKIDLIRQEWIIGPSVNRQSCDGAAAAHKRYHALSLQPLGQHQLVQIGREFLGIGNIPDCRLQRFQSSLTGADRLDKDSLLDKALSLWKIQGVQAEFTRSRIREPNLDCIPIHHFTNTR